MAQAAIESESARDEGPRPQAPDPTMERLEEQIGWYSRAAGRNRRAHWALRVSSITMAAAVPLAATLLEWNVVPALLGAGIVVVEAVHELFRVQQNWTNFAATSEALKHEKFLFIAAAGPYRDLEEPHAFLAERIESLISAETIQWVAMQDRSRRGQSRSRASEP